VCIVVFDCADVPKEAIIRPGQRDPSEALLQRKIHYGHEHVYEYHPRSMQQGKTLARIVCHYLPHLAEHPAHIHRCTNALYDSTLLSSVAEALSLPVWAA
jgi:hypothetical protein